mmetsp:Transcript_11551/g.24353  ORF Transcript_11551/g.24353 Transcript_11551/m.24353 type:complete len:93 (-) Transcript_11551:12-290(-)
MIMMIGLTILEGMRWKEGVTVARDCKEAKDRPASGGSHGWIQGVRKIIREKDVLEEVMALWILDKPNKENFETRSRLNCLIKNNKLDTDVLQ